MKLILASIAVFFSISLSSLCQTEIKEPWIMAFGVNKNSSFKDFTGMNLRFISPKFQISGEDHYWTEEEEKHPEKFKKVRFIIELLYAPSFNVSDGTSKSFVRIETPGIKIQNILVSKMHKDTLPIYYVSNTTQLREYVISANIQYRILQYKRLSAQ